MKHYFLYFCLFFSCLSYNSNPILTELNQLPDFEHLQPHHIIEARKSTEETVAAMLKEYNSRKENTRTFENTLVKLDDIYNQISKIQSTLDLMSLVHPDESIRNTARQESGYLTEFSQNLKQDKKIYNVVKEYSETEEAERLTPSQKKLMKDVLLDFKRHGLELSTKDSDLYSELLAEENNLGMLFFRNAQSGSDTLWVSENQLYGLSENYKKSHQTNNGRFYIDLPASFQEVMQTAENEEIRKKVYYARENIAKEANLSVLTKLLSTRQRLAHLLGYQNYFEYALETSMAKTSENVIRLQNRLSEKIRLIVQQQQKDLLQLKRKYSNNPELNVINSWDIQYYNKIYEKKYLQYNQGLIKNYFETIHVLNGLAEIAGRLFDIEFQEVKDPSVWHPDVSLYKVVNANKTIGYIYFDLFTRKGKGKGAYTLPLKYHKVVKDAIQYPVVAVCCNFMPPAEDNPSCLSFFDMQTLFHEFGHGIHCLLGENDFFLQKAFSVENDFLEMPSQIWENWVLDEEAISFLSRHYVTGEKMPEDLIDEAISVHSKEVFSRLLFLLQSGLADRIMHTDYSTDSSFDFEAMHRAIWNKTTTYPYPPGIYTETRLYYIGFPQYAGCMYGFLWADIYACDMFSIIKKNGIFNPETGAQFRKCILAPGSSRSANEMARCFLGRPVDDSAFLNVLGLVDQ